MKVVEYRDVVHYRPLLDPHYGYIGLAAITIATVINLTPTILESWQEYQKQLEKETIKRHQSNAR